MSQQDPKRKNRDIYFSKKDYKQMNNKSFLKLDVNNIEKPEYLAINKLFDRPKSHANKFAIIDSYQNSLMK